MDPIADMFATIKNASSAGKYTAVVPYSNIKMEIAKLLQAEGYLKDVAKRGKKAKKSIEISLLYVEKKPAISGVKRVSKLSRKMYLSVKNFGPMKKQGMRILSTPKGILSDKTARKEKVGGEVIGEVW